MFKHAEVNAFKNYHDSTAKIREYFQSFAETSFVGQAKKNIKTSKAKVHLIWINAIVPCYFEEEGYYLTRFQSQLLPIKSPHTIDGLYCQNLTDYLSKYFMS